MDKLRRKLEEFATRKVMVGIFNNPEVIEYALANEFGTENIPQRSFIRSTIFEEKGNIPKVFAQAYRETWSFDLALDRCGEYLAERVKDKIRNGNFTPNAPSTIKQKGSNHPLIDSGTLLNSIEYKSE